MARVSVIIPVYNAAKYIDKCVESIIPEMKDIEIIAVDDGSTDNSLDKIDRLADKYHGKIKYFYKENGGAGSARNIGLDVANGEFIKFVDADDTLIPGSLQKMYDIAKENNVSLVRGNYRTIIGPIKANDKCSFSDIKGSQIVDVRENKDYIITETPGVGNKLIKRDLIGDLRFPEKTKWEDLAIIPTIVASSKKVFHMDEAIYNYRAHLGTILINDFIKPIPNILDIIKCVENIEKEMTERGLIADYKEQVESIYILHTLFRVENAMLWRGFSRKKKKAVVSSLLAILDMKYPNWENNRIITLYRQKNKLFDIDMARLNKFIDDEYRSEIDRKTIEKNIEKTFVLK